MLNHNQNAIEFIQITKKFGEFVANDNININIKKGTIHALIGENGAGKSTLMSILFGIYTPTEGSIKINGKSSFIQSPNEAKDLGIGMVHQHFKLIDAYTNLENIILGSEFLKNKIFVDYELARIKVSLLQNKYNLHFDLDQKTGDATVSTQQKVEIMKMLFKDSDILVFDEPTAVLNPQEIEGFLDILRFFKNSGKTIIFISHKLHEVKSVANEATVIRLGKVVKHFPTLDNVQIDELSEAMVGKKVVIPKNQSGILSEKTGFRMTDIFAKQNKEISNINIEIKEGEILGIAGVEGNGQEEIELVISGILKPKEGKIEILDNSGQLVDITNFSVKNKNKAGISHIPGDRHKYAIVLDFTIRENAIIRELYNPKFQKLSFIKNKVLKSFYKEIQEKFDVRGDGNGNALARSLSGGNQQKAVVGREILSEHKLLVVVQPTRGLDVGAINQIYDYLLEEKKKKKCILLISYELDEVFALADSIMVINKGKLSEKRSAKNMTREQIGILMGGVHND